MKKVIVSIIALILLSMGISACGSQSVKSTRGYAYGNHVNGGWVTGFKDKMYYISKSDKGPGIKFKLMELDSGGKTRLVADSLQADLNPYLSAKDDNIYFSSVNHLLYKIDIGGGEITKVGKESTVYANPFIYDNWIYYTAPIKGNPEANWGQPCRMTPDGSKNEVLDKDTGVMLDINNSWVYFHVNLDKNNSKEAGYYKIKTDGSDKTPLNLARLDYANITDEWIYYQDPLENALYKVKTDGSDKTKLLEGRFSFINVYNDWIYFSDDSANSNLCKIKTDGSNLSILCTDTCRMLQIMDDWIYYIGKDFASRYRIKIDGTDKSKLE